MAGVSTRARVMVALVVCLLDPAGGVARGEAQSVAGPTMAAAAAGPLSKDWTRVRSLHFEAVGNASAADLRKALRELEAFRAAFSTLYPGLRLDSPSPTLIVVFRDSDAFNRYRPRDLQGRPITNVAGYFSSRAHVNVIAFDAHASDGGYTAALHEFTHYVIARHVPTLSLWLSEGLAEFFSTFRSDGPNGKSVVGLVPEGRLRAFDDQGFMPLKEVLAPADVQGLWASGRVALFYAEAWALVHYLATGPGLPIDAYVRAFRDTRSPEAAFRAAFGTDIPAMERTLQGYVRRFGFSTLSLALPEYDPTTAEAEPMREADVHAVLGDLLLGHGAFEEADREFAIALRLDRSHIDARVGTARLLMYKDREVDAVAALGATVREAPESFNAWFYLGAALEFTHQFEEALAAFDRALLIRPNAPSALVAGSVAALALGRDDRADEAFAHAQRVDLSALWFRNRAFAAFGVGRNDVARADARRYLDQVGWDKEGAPYVGFLSAIASWRLGRPDAATVVLDEAAREVPQKTWTGSVLQFLRGQIDAKTILSRAKDDGQRTEAHAYVGFRASLNGRVEDALVHLRWVAAHGARNYAEYDMARREIFRLTGAAEVRR